MASQPFAQLIGQPQAVHLLTRAIARNRIAPAYLFVGPAGTGRALAAKEFLNLLIQHQGKIPSRRLNQENHPDILRVEPTYLQKGKLIPVSAFRDHPDERPKARPQIRVAQIREITQFIHQSPLEAPRLLVILDEAETLGEAAANGLLKTLEEPGHACLILISTSLDALLPTIISRCQKIPFYALSKANMTTVLQQEGHPEILADPKIMALAMGSPGQAIIHWQQRQRIDQDLLNQCLALPQSDRDGLALARQIDQTLDIETQLWLADYLQQYFWYQVGNVGIIEVLEMTKTCLRQYVQPLLTWEVTWLDIAAILLKA